MLREESGFLVRRLCGFYAGFLTVIVLLMSFCPSAEATTVNGYVAPAQTISNVYLLSIHYNLNDSNYAYYIRHISDEILAGQNTTFTADIPDSAFSVYSIHQYTIAGLYDFDNYRVSIGIEPTQAAAAINAGTNWPGYFGESITEYSVSNGLKDTTQSLESFFCEVSGCWDQSTPGIVGENYGQEVTIVDFCTADYGGEGRVWIPEPATIAIVLTGAGFISMKRRRH